MAAERFVAKAEVLRLVRQCMSRVGTDDGHAGQLGELLLAADYRGHYSHGLNRLDMYVKDVESGLTAARGTPQIVKESCSTALVDGSSLLGPVVGKFCTDLAVRKAKANGVGWVAARNSNHFGIAGWYAMRACRSGLLGLAFTNTSPVLVPTRAASAALGTNPISLAAPSSRQDDPFVLDMATSAVALGKIEIQLRRGQPLPSGWALGPDGSETKDPQVGMQGRLCPLGGSEQNSGYKGYGLAALVEILCGVLSGAEWGPNIRLWKTQERKANLGQCFIAVNPEMFADGFADRMKELMDTFRAMQPADPDRPVLVAGDPERQHMLLCDTRGGIPYQEAQLLHLNSVASELNVEPLQPLSP